MGLAYGVGVSVGIGVGIDIGYLAATQIIVT